MNTVRPRPYQQTNGNYKANGGETDKDGHNQNSQDQQQGQNSHVVARGRAQDIQQQNIPTQLLIRLAVAIRSVRSI